MTSQEEVTLFERVSDSLATTSPQLHALLAGLELLDREVYGALLLAAREAAPDEGDDALVERAARHAGGPSDPHVVRALDAAAAFPDEPRRWREQALGRLQASRPESFALAQSAGRLDERLDAIVAAGHRAAGRCEAQGMAPPQALLLAKVAMLDALDEAAAPTDLSSPVALVAEKVRTSSPEAYAVLSRLGLLERQCRNALLATLRPPPGDEAASTIERAAAEAATLRDPSIRRMGELAEIYSDDAALWKDDTVRYLRRTSPERARAAEQANELDYIAGAVAAVGRRTLAQAGRDGLGAGAAAARARISMADALAKGIDGPNRIIARARAFLPISFLEFDLLQTWVTWGETGQAGLWEFSRVMETVASEPQLGRVLEHSLFDVGSVDGGVLLEMLRGAREYGQGRIEQALARFERAAAVATNPLLCMCIANTYRALGRNREALATLEAGMARWPQDDSLRPPAVGIAFALGQAEYADRLLEPIRAAYFGRFKDSALIAERRRELAEAIAEGRLYREEKSDIYDEAYAEQTWWNYWFHFNAFTRYQHSEGILGELAPECLSRFLKARKRPPPVCIEVGTMCGEVLYRTARAVPQTRFVGVDRNPVVRRLNEQTYKLPNLEFRADDILNVLEDRSLDLEGAVLFHVRTSPFLLPDFMRKMYATCREKGFGAISMLESYPPSIAKQKLQTFEEMEEITEIRLSGLMHHNYPRILREAGWPKVDYRFVETSLLLSGLETSLFLTASDA